MAKAEQFLIVFCLWQSWALVVPPPPVCCCKHPAFFQTNHFQIGFREKETKCKTSCTVVDKTSAFSTQELKCTRQYFIKKNKKKAEYLSFQRCSIYLNPHKHLFSCTHTEEPKYYNHTHTHTPQATANLLPRSMKRDLHCDAIL